MQATDADIDVFANKLKSGELSLGGTSQSLRHPQTGDDVSKKLPAAERALRLEQQKTRFARLPLDKGQWQVARSLYDRYASMRESEEL